MGQFANILKLQSKQKQQTIGRSSHRRETSPKVPPVKQGPVQQRDVYSALVLSAEDIPVQPFTKGEAAEKQAPRLARRFNSDI